MSNNTSHHDDLSEQDHTVDPEMQALLDDALGGDDTPPYLAQRITESTLPHLHVRRRPGPVLARIGPIARPLLHLAAVIVIGAFVVFALYNAQTPSATPSDPITTETNLNTPTEAKTNKQAIIESAFASLENAIQSVDNLNNASTSDQTTDSLDAQMDLLAIRIELASTDLAWNDADALLDDSLNQLKLEEHDALSSLFF